MKDYEALEARFGRTARISEAMDMLEWDRFAMMPVGGSVARAEQVATLEVLVHEMLTDPSVEALLESAESRTEHLDAWQRANLVEMRRDWVHANAVPSDLVERLSKAGAACEMRWRSARADNDFASLAPALTDVVALVRQKAAAKSAAMDCSPYDALLDQFEPDGRSATIDALFDDLGAFLPDFTQRVLDAQSKRPAPVPLKGPFPVAKQRALGVRLMERVGFDFHHGRLDVSHHPFCVGSGDDIRITTRYNEQDFVESLMGVLHETGHALYERGLPSRWHYQPVGRARSTAIHESQSLLIEMQACRSAQFLRFAAPIIRQTFGGEGAKWESENLHLMYTRVSPSLIRVDADEVTYPAHVILRYRLEKAMVAGDLEVVDLPGAWREGMKSLLGIAPHDDRDGCMQDIHWMNGTIGYFPTYTLGAMMAAQIFTAAKAADPAILPAIEQGDFQPLFAWLGAHIHQRGSSLSTDELLIASTGTPLNAQVYQAHLKRRYLPDETSK